MRIGRVLAAFPYEMLITCDGSFRESKDGKFYLHGAELPRQFLSQLEDELAAKSGVTKDNKTSYIFEEQASYESEGKSYNCGDLCVVTFWDGKATLVKFHRSWLTQRGEVAPKVPDNIVQGAEYALKACLKSIETGEPIQVRRQDLFGRGEMEYRTKSENDARLAAWHEKCEADRKARNAR